MLRKVCHFSAVITIVAYQQLLAMDTIMLLYEESYFGDI